jgi:hypothetical protein
MSSSSSSSRMVIFCKLLEAEINLLYICVCVCVSVCTEMKLTPHREHRVIPLATPVGNCSVQK